MADKDIAKTILEGITDIRNRLRAIVEKAIADNDFDAASERIRRWKERSALYIGEKLSTDEAVRFRKKRLNVFSNNELEDFLSEISIYDGFLKALEEEIEDNLDLLPSRRSHITATQGELEARGKLGELEYQNVTDADPQAKEHCVFIGHGRSSIWARLQIFIEKELHLKTVNYESESRVGDSIVPILEKMLSEASFAILILTAEDETTVGSKRARQNVIHEAGLFQGRLGFKKAILLRQEGTEEFTNIAGLQYISFSADRIDQTFYELRRVLKREGLITTL